MHRVSPCRPLIFICAGAPALVLLALALGCGFDSTRPRPENRFGGAVPIDGLFINCSISTTTNSDDCSIWDSKGALLQDGPFLINEDGRSATNSELRFAAYRDHKIFLQGGRYLYPVERPVGKEPPIDSSLLPIAGGGEFPFRNCGRIAIEQDRRPASDCALKAITDKAPFTVRYAMQGYEGPYFFGLAGDNSGKLYAADDYSFLADVPPIVNEPGNVRYPVRLSQRPCPSPTKLRLTPTGMLTCMSTNP